MELRSRFSRILLVLISLPFVLRFILVWQDLERLSKAGPLLEDDFYYYLNIARNVVRGRGFSADGETVTTGFQVLHELFCVAVTAIVGTEHHIAFRVVLTSQVLLSCASAYGVFRLVKHLFGFQEALLSTLLFSWWIPFLRHGNNGLETPLLIALFIWILYEIVKFEGEAGIATMIGMLIGVAVLTRIDAVAMGGAVTLYALITAVRSRTGKRWWRLLFWTSGGVIAGLIVTVTLNLSINGSVVQDSGMAMRELALLYSSGFGVEVDPFNAIKRIAGVLIDDHLFMQLIRHVDGVRWLLFAVVGLAVPLLCVVLYKKGSESARALLWIVALSGISLSLFYALVVPAYWFYSRYLFPVSIGVFLLTIPTLLSIVLRSTRLRMPIILAFGGCVIATWMFQWWSLMTIPLNSIADGELRGRELSQTRVCHNYDIAKWINLNLPPETRLAMWQGGLVAYLIPHHLIHLDGVVNGEARRARKENALDHYLCSRGVGYLIDFHSVSALVVAHSSPPGRTFKRVSGSNCADKSESVILFSLHCEGTR